MQKIKLSLTNYTAIAFSTFLFITISVFITVSYNRMSQIAQDATSQQFQRYVHDIYTSVSYKYKPITQYFNYLSTSSDWNNDKVSEISLIKAIDLVRYLAKDTLTNAIYMGFPSGDLLSAHKLGSKTKKYYDDAPENANFVIETLEYQQTDANKLTRVYLSNNFKIIDTTVTLNDSLNIFEQDWYKIGLQSPNLVPTPIYKDLRTNEDSLTLVQKHQFSDVIIATDLNISTIVNSLKASELSNDAIRVIFGDKGQFVIYHKNNSLFSNVSDAANNDDMGNLLQKTKFKKIISANLNKNKLFTFNFKGEEWLAQTHNISIIQNNNARLLIAVPKNSIFGPSKKCSKIPC